MRFRFLAAAAAAFAGCAGAPARPSVEAEALQELRSQLQAQSALVAQQQRRIEELEVRLAALAARSAQASPPHGERIAPSRPDPRPVSKMAKVGGRLRRNDRANPVEHAPSLPVDIALREPDPEALARLEVDLLAVSEFDADHAWADAVRKLNEGRHAEAESDFLSFAAAHPRHSAADNALYLAGLVREVRGDCAGALQLFESVPRKYPAGDAVPQAQLERGRCLRILGRKDEAKSVLTQLGLEHPHASETAQSRRLLQDL